MFQSLLVSGGETSSSTLASTELLVGSADAWVFAGDLPSPRNGLRGANIDKKVLMTGNWYLQRWSLGNSEVTILHFIRLHLL